jgi:FKBP-type peptidyl-prolyl cis-trans isomerase FkpA
MTRSAVIAVLVSCSSFAACGGGRPADQTPGKPDEATKPAEMPAAPPNNVGPAVTPPPAPAAPRAPRPPAKAPERPAFARTDLQVGTGRDAEKGKGLSVHYTGWLYDPSQPDLKGRMFDSSQGRGPFNFVLGAGQVIPGWDQGFDGMKIGGRRRLIIPPDLAYGVDGAGGGIIPPDATLLFEMELLDVQQ